MFRAEAAVFFVSPRRVGVRSVQRALGRTESHDTPQLVLSVVVAFEAQHQKKEKGVHFF